MLLTIFIDLLAKTEPCSLMVGWQLIWQWGTHGYWPQEEVTARSGLNLTICTKDLGIQWNQHLDVLTSSEPVVVNLLKDAFQGTKTSARVNRKQRTDWFATNMEAIATENNESDKGDLVTNLQ